MSFPIPDQVEDDTKDTVYQTAGIAFFLSLRYICLKMG